MRIKFKNIKGVVYMFMYKIICKKQVLDKNWKKSIKEGLKELYNAWRNEPFIIIKGGKKTLTFIILNNEDYEYQKHEIMGTIDNYGIPYEIILNQDYINKDFNINNHSIFKVCREKMLILNDN
jgi:hypothetical protein